MKQYKNILETIGNTPMVEISKLNPNKDITLLAKLEMLNLGGSIKDRMAVYIIEDAEKRGLLKPGGTIVEATSGNTGIGLALVALVKGYKAIIVTSDKTSQEKVSMLKIFEAKVVITPSTALPGSPDSCIETAKRIAKETSNSFYADQYNNPKNPQAHYLTTGPEIWQQTNGKIDYLVAGMGTGGTISGIAKYLKGKNPQVKIIGVDPKGSVFHDYFKTKKLIKPKQYKIEGIGGDMLVEALNFKLIDDVIQVNDKQAFDMAKKLLKEEGIFVGGSSGAAMFAVLKLIKKINEQKTMVVIFPDGGYRYLSKIFTS